MLNEELLRHIEETVEKATERVVKKATKEALNEEVKSFYVDRETHYQDHQYLKELREWTESIKSTARRTIVKAIVTAIIGLIVLGFAVWGKKHLNG